ncbi:MAG: hypothetical protein JNL07_11910 [Rhodospirillales bacterium]|nr:hypothetical protein [Rhodospirillales bacterium]
MAKTMAATTANQRRIGRASGMPTADSIRGRDGAKGGGAMARVLVGDPGQVNRPARRPATVAVVQLHLENDGEY